MEGLKKAMEKLGIAGVPVEIQTEHFPNKNLKRYHVELCLALSLLRYVSSQLPTRGSSVSVVA
jgi:hypothetical protein